MWTKKLSRIEWIALLFYYRLIQDIFGIDESVEINGNRNPELNIVYYVSRKLQTMAVRTTRICSDVGINNKTFGSDVRIVEIDR